MKVIFHIDLDSYFASAHQVIDISLRNKAIGISGGGRRGIIVAASYEAKALGVKTGMPIYAALELIPKLIIVKPDFSLYLNLTTKMFELLTEEYTKEIEVLSIDECYLDVTKIWQKYGSPINLAKHIQEKIMSELKLPASFGIAENKFVAKMSSPINKPYGIKVCKPGEFLKEFGDFELAKFYGIGKPTAAKLNKIEIYTIKDLSRSKRDALEPILGKRWSSYLDQANGKGSDVIKKDLNELKGIGNSITFRDYDKNIRRELLEILSNLTLSVSHRTSLRNMVGNIITVGIKVAGNKDIKVQTKQIKIDSMISTHEDIFRVAVRLFDDLWDDETLKFLSVRITGLVDMYESSRQPSLFEPQEDRNNIDFIMQDVNSSLKNKDVVSGKEFINNVKKQKSQSRFLDNDRLLSHEALRKNKK